MIYNSKLLNDINYIIKDNKIDYIFPANDLVIDKLVEFRKEIDCNIILPDSSVVELIRSKRKTYDYFKDIIPVPKEIKNQDNINIILF